MMMDNHSEEPAAAIRIGVAQQNKNEHKSPPSPKQQQPPGPPSMITVVDEDDVEPPFTSCNAIDSRALAELLEKDAMKLDDDTTASQEGAKLKKPEQSRHDHRRSSSNCIGIDIDGLIATMSPTKKKQQPITTPG